MSNNHGRRLRLFVGAHRSLSLRQAGAEGGHSCLSPTPWFEQEPDAGVGNFLVSLAPQGNAFLTAQTPDLVRLGRGLYAVYGSPVIEPPGAPFASFDQISSGNWRGYQAKWLVKSRGLYLEDFAACLEGAQIGMADLYGVTAPIHVSWFSGSMFVPCGEDLGYQHWGFGRVPSHFRRMTFSRGALEADELIKNLDLLPCEPEHFVVERVWDDHCERRRPMWQADDNLWTSDF